MAKIEPRTRKYFAPEFDVEKWTEVESALRGMLEAPLASAWDLVALIHQCGELSDLMGEAAAWKQIRMTQHADDPTLIKAQTDFYEQILAPSQPLFFELDKKIIGSEYFSALPAERYAHLGKLLRKEIELYRKENIPLFVKENDLSNRYGELYSQLTVEFEGEQKTLQEMIRVQKDPDRARRERAWRLVADRMKEARPDFERLFDELKAVRIQIAKNAGFDNYRDYKHAALGRFDYTPEDLLSFHAAIEAVAVPAMRKVDEQRQRILGVETLRPWDLQVDLDGKVLKPFEDTARLLAGCVRIMRRIDPEFAEILSSLEENGLLDLGNRKGKAPGGYNCSLPMTGASFIFMNAVGIQYDVATLTHETGHGINAYLSRLEPIAEYKEEPAELAELASMAMELIAADYMDEFYADPADIRKAKCDKLEDTLAIFPMVAVIDAFQHWIYLHPECTPAERNAQFRQLKDRFNTNVDWSGLEEEEGNSWLRVLHIFEVPFYYIEYSLAQLGAIALYKAYKEDPQAAIANYKRFAALGYAEPLKEIYQAAGIKFDFGADYLREMVDFIAAQWEEVKMNE